jgi:tetratricopeptide (TPR) repeat protein
VEFLEKLPNVDSQPEALRALLRSHLQLGNTPEAVPLATKLLVVHNELGGVIAVANALMAAGEFEGALRLYSQHGERLLAANTAGLLEGLYACIERIKENAEALQLLRDLFQKAGETAHLNEVTELLAHACVHSGELFKARDYYQQLSEVEPENPLHTQNYRQIVARLGEDSATRPLTEEERGQAFMVDELEISAPAIEQQYPEEIAAAVRSALTDSELLDSYNLPAKAIAPLEAALPHAPQDAMLNQRLASLYARVERFNEAAHCCEVLHDVYSQAGYADLAGQYADMAAKYHERVGESPSEPVPHADVIPMPLATPQEAELSPQPAEPVGTQAPTAAQAWDTPPHDTHAHEIDASHDWERLVSVEPVKVLETAQAHAGASSESAVAERLEEIRFYLAQSMLDEAEAAIATCARLAPAVPELAALREQLAAARAGEPAAPEIEVEIQEVPSETASPQPSISALVFDETALGLAAPRPAHDEVASPAVERPVTDIRPPLIQPPPIVVPPPPLAQPAAAAATDVLGNFALELDRSLGADFNLAPPSSPRPEPPAAARITGIAIQQQTAIAVAEPVAPPAPSTAAPTIASETSAPAPASPLADIFEAFKQGLEEGKGEETDDPETHYNLGIAFREMGLVDEAIGELQKVCQAIERGFPFPYAIHAYTWLAHCLCDKGVPQAAVKWYEKALRLSNLDDESRLGVYYELASAHEAAGNRQAALANFMEVYATNIDYRDVAERIKSLKS